MKDIRSILFVCTGNTCRSPMAAGYLNHLAWSAESQTPIAQLSARSAGIFAQEGTPISDNALAVMKKYGFEPLNRKSVQINSDMIARADLVLVMTQQHRVTLAGEYPDSAEKIMTLKKFTTDEDGEIADPFGGSMDSYEDTFLEMKDCLDRLNNVLSAKK